MIDLLREIYKPILKVLDSEMILPKLGSYDRSSLTQLGIGIEWIPGPQIFRHLKKRYTLHVHTAGGRKGHTLHAHTAGNGKGHTLYTFILLAVEGDTPIHPSRPYCWRWKWSTLHVHSVGCGKWIHPGRLYCWLWKGIQPAIPFCWLWKWILSVVSMSVLLAGERDTTCTSILLDVEIDTSCAKVLRKIRHPPSGESPFKVTAPSPKVTGI
jgi:hypothetical protein